MKLLKIVVILVLVIVSIPSYYRHCESVDRRVASAWGELQVFWSGKSQDVRDLNKALEHPLNMGKGGKSSREIHDEVIKKSEERIEAQESRDSGVSPGQQN